MTGKNWVHGFLKRHPDLLSRQATAAGIERAIGLNKIQAKSALETLFVCWQSLNLNHTASSTWMRLLLVGPNKVPKRRDKLKVVSGGRRRTMSDSGNFVRYQVLTAASMKFIFVFWDVLPCEIIVDRRFRGTCCLHHQDVHLKRLSSIMLHGCTSQKTNMNFWKLCSSYLTRKG
jgi:hypothetical protein